MDKVHLRRHFNNLEEGELERLALIAEECGEVTQAVGKIVRHGYGSTHPDEPEGYNNRDNLEKELADLLVVIELATARGDISRERMLQHAARKLEKIPAYLHHNNVKGIQIV